MSATSAIPSTLSHALDSLHRLTAAAVSDSAALLHASSAQSPQTTPAAAATPPPLPLAAAHSSAASDGAAGAAHISARLVATVREVTELNDRIMAQNIALMSDLEAAQRTVREMRAAKDALAAQLKRALVARE
jgi:hypothetical protein